MGVYIFNDLERYKWETHRHRESDFDIGNSSTSYIKSLCHQLKSKIKKMNNSIPDYNFLYNLRVAEWRVQNRNLNIEKKIEELFSYFVFINYI